MSGAAAAAAEPEPAATAAVPKVILNLTNSALMGTLSTATEVDLLIQKIQERFSSVREITWVERHVHSPYTLRLLLHGALTPLFSDRKEIEQFVRDYTPAPPAPLKIIPDISEKGSPVYLFANINALTKSCRARIDYVAALYVHANGRPIVSCNWVSSSSSVLDTFRRCIINYFKPAINMYEVQVGLLEGKICECAKNLLSIVPVFPANSVFSIILDEDSREDKNFLKFGIPSKSISTLMETIENITGRNINVEIFLWKSQSLGKFIYLRRKYCGNEKIKFICYDDYGELYYS